MSEQQPNGETPSTEAIDSGYGTAVIDLTDEEMQVIDPTPVDERLVVMPYYDDLDEEQRKMAFTTAYRSLLARELVEAPAEEDVEAAQAKGPDASIEIGVNEVLSGLAQMRKIAPTIVCAQRTVTDRPDYCYWYILPGGSTLEELVEPTGLHRFRAMDTDLVDVALYGYLNPQRAAGAAGEDVQVDAGEAAAGRTPAQVLSHLGSTNTLGEFIIRHGGTAPENPTLISVGTTDQRVMMAELRYGSGEAVRVREVTASTMYARVKEAVDAALAEPQEQPDGDEPA
jgi:hypothetical protein